MVPAVRDGFAFEYGHEEAHEEVAGSDCLGQDANGSEVPNDAEDTVVKKYQRSLDGDGCAEIRQLDAQRGLSG